MSKKAALGRGLGALISEAAEVRRSEIAEAVTGYEIEIDKIDVNPNQPRAFFDEDSLGELTDSIKIHGVIQPLTLREQDDGRYRIISGERRYRAAKSAGLTTVPAYIRKADDRETLEMALVENIQREDLNAVEIAVSYRRLMDECGLTQETLSERVGKKRATVANYLRLLSLEDDVLQAIRDKTLSMGHARALVGIADGKLQRKLAEKIVAEELSVRQIEELIKKTNEPKAPKVDGGRELPENFRTLTELLESNFKGKIRIKRNNNGEGSIIINFASDDDIEEFIKNLSK